MAGESNGLSKSCAMVCSWLYASYSFSLPREKKRSGLPPSERSGAASPP